MNYIFVTTIFSVERNIRVQETYGDRETWIKQKGNMKYVEKSKQLFMRYACIFLRYCAHFKVIYQIIKPRTCTARIKHEKGRQKKNIKGRKQ